MKSTTIWIKLIGLSFGLLLPAAAYAQNAEGGEEGAKADPQVGEADGERDRDGDGPDMDRAKRRRGPRPGDMRGDPREYLRKLDKLQQLMRKELDLSDKQVEETRQIIGEHREQIRKQRQSGESGDESKNAAAELRRLREERREARRSGDRKAVDRLREKMAEIARARHEARLGAVSKFIKDLSNELDAEQRAGFHDIVQRIGLNRPTVGRRDGLTSLMRALYSQELKLTEDQRNAVRVAMREVLTNVAPDARANGLEGATQKILDRVMESLNPEQQEKLRALLEASENDDRNRRARRRARPERGEGSETEEKESKQGGSDDD